VGGGTDITNFGEGIVIWRYIEQQLDVYEPTCRPYQIGRLPSIFEIGEGKD
jgi:hypothetical protein